MDGVPRGPEQRGPGSSPEPETLRFGVLGPVRAWRGETPVATGSPQQRALLAALLLREGRTATAAELIDALWGEEPPSQALAAVRTYASRLRKVLDPGVLVSESGGYAVRGLGEGALDLGAAQELAAEAEKARYTGDLCRARDLLNQALTLWDGETLAGVPGPYAEAQRVRLEEWRLQLLETRLDMDLEQGCHAEAVSELTALTAAHPLRERLRELLMLALYRSGRQAEALAVYADTRRLLADELGVDPRPDLSELQQRILEADPALAGPPAAPAQTEPAPVRPAQLPASVPDFTGRAAFVRELGEVLASATGEQGQVMAVSAVAGIGGVGKTTLAVHVAHAARDAFPDGQLYVDLQGAGASAAEPETVLGSFLRALGTADTAIPRASSRSLRPALYRPVLDGRRVLSAAGQRRATAAPGPAAGGRARRAAPPLSDVPECATLDLARGARRPSTGRPRGRRARPALRPPRRRSSARSPPWASAPEAGGRPGRGGGLTGLLPLAIGDRRRPAGRPPHLGGVRPRGRSCGGEGRRLAGLQAGDLAAAAPFRAGPRSAPAGAQASRSRSGCWAWPTARLVVHLDPGRGGLALRDEDVLGPADQFLAGRVPEDHRHREEAARRAVVGDLDGGVRRLLGRAVDQRHRGVLRGRRGLRAAGRAAAVVVVVVVIVVVVVAVRAAARRVVVLAGAAASATAAAVVAPAAASVAAAGGEAGEGEDDERRDGRELECLPREVMTVRLAIFLSRSCHCLSTVPHPA
ncbi:hypothetical protein SALBM217S_10859 [Streptomyces griseoloalbus]